MAKRKKNTTACERIAYRFYGIPSERDAVLENKTFGCCRYLWNRMLGDHNTLYAEIGSVPDNTPADYKDLDECSFLNEVDSLALANTALNLDTAFERFFKKNGGYPKFKAKKRAKRSYTTNAVYQKLIPCRNCTWTVTEILRSFQDLTEPWSRSFPGNRRNCPGKSRVPSGTKSSA